jgi:outer membrane protein OmpA-like peptidoglycan-associated protein
MKLRSALPAISLALLVATTGPATAGDNPKCGEHPLFSRFSGETLENCDRSRYAKLELWRWKNPAKQGGGQQAFTVEGEYWYYFNDIAKDAQGRPAGKLEVQRNFENAVRQAKGEILATNESSAKVFYHIARDDGEYWGEAGCGRGGSADCSAIMHKVVRTAAMQQSVVSAEQIGAALADSGKMVFYGILFDTDQATLKNESAPALSEMAKWLKANPKAGVFIVGHTDMQGSHEHNLELSRNRAAAVVGELVKKYGVATDRLTPAGVGSLAPVAVNTSEAGRAKNRRVEMVLR